tara:strand:- start:137 stop:1630 length:1494 start_codon:yes stop_codon:yes gene_type:complete
MASWKKVIVSGSSAELSGLTLDTQLAVAQGGTGATTLTDGGVLLGSGTGAITATAVLANGEMLVGDGSTDPAIESGATLRTSIGVGTGDSPQFTDLTLTGGDITVSGAATDIDVIDNNSSALSIDASGKAGILEIDSTNNKEQVKMSGGLFLSGNMTASAGTVSASAFIGDGSGLTNIAAADLDIDAFSEGTALHQTQDHFLYSDNGTEKKITFSNVEDAIFGNVSGDATIAAGGALTIAADSVENSMLANIARGSVKVGGGSNAPTDLDAKGDGKILVGDGTDINSVAVSGDVTLANDGAVTIASNAVEGSMLNSNVAGSGIDFTSNELRVDVSDFMSNGSNNRVLTATGTDGQNAEANLTFDGSTLALTGALTVSSNATITGNLTVNGSTTAISSSNLLIADRFALFNSGSGATGDGGFLVGSGSAGSGSALVFDDSADRFGVQIDTQLAQDATTSTPEAYTSLYVLNANTGSATYNVKGNIKIDDSSGDIFIYS